MKILWMLILSVLLIASGAFASDEVELAKSQLSREIAILNKISPTLKREDKGRIFILQSATTKVEASIERNGIGHMETVRAYQELILAYRFSRDFFRKVQSVNTRESISELMKINQTIAEAKGFDDSPYTRLIAGIFSQMEKHLEDLSKTEISDSLRQKLGPVYESIGKAVGKDLAIGDRPPAFELGDRTYMLVKSLYPDLQTIPESSSAFEIVLGIQGLNEYYSEYSLINSRTKE